MKQQALFTFLLSSDRSGSNLFLRLFDSHPEVCAPPPAQMLPFMTSMSYLYGDLAQSENWRGLVGDVVELHRAGFGHWSRYTELEELLHSKIDRSLGNILHRVYSNEARAHDKNRLMVKAHQAFSYANFLQTNFPAAKYIYLVRDPRDMALSWKLTPGLRGGVLRAAETWQRDQQGFLRLVDDQVFDERVLIISYEDLIQDAVRVLGRVCEFLEIQYSEEMFSFYSKRSTKINSRKIDAWKNLGNPLDNSNSGKYRKQLSLEEVKYVEAVCKNEMGVFGYQIESDVESTDLTALRADLKPIERWEKKEYLNLPLEERKAHARLRKVMSEIEQRLITM
jgi:hypothetical protein